MGFFDSIKKVAKSVKDSLGVESKEEKASRISKENKEKENKVKQDEYLNILGSFLYTLDPISLVDDEEAISAECAKRVVRHFLNEELDEEILSETLKNRRLTLKSYAQHSYHYRDKIKPIDPLLCIELACPGVTEKIREGAGSALDDACKYKDYTIDSSTKRFLDSLAPRISGCAADLIVPEIQKRILKNDTALCQEILNERTSPLTDILLNSETDYEEKSIILMGAACRICNFASYSDQEPYAPISKGKWMEIVTGTWGSKLEGLSPEGCEKVTNRYLDLVTKRIFKDYSYASKAMKNEAVYDAMMYHSYIYYLQGNEYGKKEDHRNIVDVYKVLLDCLVNSATQGMS